MVDTSKEAPWLVTLRWLVRLRWASLAGQLLVIAFARVSSPEGVGLQWPAALVGAVIVSNVYLQVRSTRANVVSDRLLASVLLFDVAILTVLLALSGGPGNPFSVVFLVQVTLAAVVLGARWAWLLVAATVTAFGALFFVVSPDQIMRHMHGNGQGVPIHLQGMWLAFAATASLIAYFVTRIASELRARETEVRELGRRAALNDKLASLSTLAAGAAHELGTPLGTIALAAKELERALDALPSPALAQDAQLIRTEVERCRGILSQLSANTGQSAGEMSMPVLLEDLSSQLSESLAKAERARVQISSEPNVRATLPRMAVVQAVRTLVRNGLDAGPGDVSVRLGRTGVRLQVTVEDSGAGMDAAVLARAGEPFFTTKPVGKGLGLGLFLARAVAERLGGELTLDSEPGRGTIARIDLPGAGP
jgi:two-component system, sensor histidine kinase RegB